MAPETKRRIVELRRQAKEAMTGASGMLIGAALTDWLSVWAAVAVAATYFGLAVLIHVLICDAEKRFGENSVNG